MTTLPYIANTDQKWFEFLSSVVAPRGSRSGVVEEANFWFPNTTAPRLKAISAGTPVFLRLKSPKRAIAGVGFFAAYHMLPLDEAWLAFGEGNGDPSQHRFESRIRSYRTGRSFDVSLRETDRSSLAAPLACMILRAVEFWPRERWIPWAEAEGFKPQIVSGKYEEDPARIARLMNAIGEAREIRAAEFADRFVLPTEDARATREVGAQAVREGQASFRLRLLDAYGNQCAVTGEHTTPVLDAAHIHPYRGPASNHLQNGLILTKEFHALFDRGYVTVTPDYRVRVSPLLRADFSNGRRYYPYDNATLAKLPDDTAARPSQEALEWHGKTIFRAG
jgi:putative restriction endonuclease